MTRRTAASGNLTPPAVSADSDVTVAEDDYSSASRHHAEDHRSLSRPITSPATAALGTTTTDTIGTAGLPFTTTHSGDFVAVTDQMTTSPVHMGTTSHDRTLQRRQVAPILQLPTQEHTAGNLSDDNSDNEQSQSQTETARDIILEEGDTTEDNESISPTAADTPSHKPGFRPPEQPPLFRRSQSISSVPHDNDSPGDLEESSRLASGLHDSELLEPTGEELELTLTAKRKRGRPRRGEEVIRSPKPPRTPAAKAKVPAAKRRSTASIDTLAVSSQPMSARGAMAAAAMDANLAKLRTQNKYGEKKTGGPSGKTKAFEAPPLTPFHLEDGPNFRAIDSDGLLKERVLVRTPEEAHAEIHREQAMHDRLQQALVNTNVLLRLFKNKREELLSCLTDAQLQGLQDSNPAVFSEFRAALDDPADFTLPWPPLGLAVMKKNREVLEEAMEEFEKLCDQAIVREAPKLLRKQRQHDRQSPMSSRLALTVGPGSARTRRRSSTGTIGGGNGGGGSNRSSTALSLSSELASSVPHTRIHFAVDATGDQSPLMKTPRESSGAESSALAPDATDQPGTLPAEPLYGPRTGEHSIAANLPGEAGAIATNTSLVTYLAAATAVDASQVASGPSAAVAASTVRGSPHSSGQNAALQLPISPRFAIVEDVDDLDFPEMEPWSAAEARAHREILVDDHFNTLLEISPEEWEVARKVEETIKRDCLSPSYLPCYPEPYNVDPPCPRPGSAGAACISPLNNTAIAMPWTVMPLEPEVLTRFHLNDFQGAVELFMEKTQKILDTSLV